MQNPYLKDEKGETTKIYLNEQGYRELKGILDSGIIKNAEVETFARDCITAFEDRKRRTASTDRYEEEKYGVTEITRCCVVYAPYSIIEYFRSKNNVFSKTKGRIDEQVLLKLG